VTEVAGEHHLGQVRTCSVVVSGKHGQTKERCVVEEPASRIGWSVEEDSTGFGRMVLNWCAGFSLTPCDGKTLVSAESSFEPNNMLVRAMLPMIAASSTRPSGQSSRHFKNRSRQTATLSS
jgi:hypothetical protein